MKNRNNINKNIYAVYASKEFDNGRRHYDILEEFYLSKSAALSCILKLKTATPPIPVKKYFNFKIIKYSKVK
jgi:hypothetical protein